MEEVLTHVSQGVSSYCDGCIYGIAKKPDGYFLTIESIDNNPHHALEFVKVWDRNTLSFVRFDASKFESKQRFHEIPEEFKLLFSRAPYYDFFLFYGYKDWANDSRSLLSSTKYKSPQDLEILARAASSEAVAFIRPGMTGDHFDIEKAFKDGGYAKVGAVQRENFQKKADEALTYWKQLNREHPTYKPLIIDDISLKLGNEFMNFYLLANSIMETPMASTFLSNAYYNEAWIRYAKNLLDACDPNGILFTSGDSDTYPLMYVQEKMGYRKDVIVINTSLLNTGWYWEMIQKTHDISSTISAKQYQKLEEKPVYIDYEAFPAPYGQWLTKRLKDEDTLTYYLAPSEFIISYQSSNLTLSLKTQMLTVSDLIVLDILSNTEEHTVYSSSPYEMVNLGLYNNLATTGRAFSIVNDLDDAMESLQTMERIENLATNTTIPYLNALGSASAGEISILSFLVLNIPPNFKVRKEALITKITGNLTPEAVVKTENFALIEAVNAFYEVLNPKASEQIRAQLQPLASDLILNTTAMSMDLKSDFEKLEHLFSIYAHFRVQEQPEYDLEFSEIDKKVLSALYEKVEQLSESPVVQERAWSRLQIFRMLDAFDRIALD